MTTHSEYVKAYRADLRQAGLCIHCKAPVHQRHKCCLRHMIADNERSRRAYRKRTMAKFATQDGPGSIGGTECDNSLVQKQDRF